jgi:hypothetical protein
MNNTRDQQWSRVLWFFTDGFLRLRNFGQLQARMILDNNNQEGQARASIKAFRFIPAAILDPSGVLRPHSS